MPDVTFITGKTSIQDINTSVRGRSSFTTHSSDTRTAAPAEAAVTPAFSWSLDGEEWRPAYRIRDLGIKPLPGYFVSNLGRACHRRRGVLKPTTSHGHLMVWFGYPYNLGRVILASWWGPPPSPGLGTFFRDGDKTNLEPNNLSWGRHVRVVPDDGRKAHWKWRPYP